jgi:hypothetical protein
VGTVKDRQMEKEENWKELCRRKGWICQICGAYPTDIGKPAGYEDGLCPNCRNPKD